jgi:hypothetical protein
MKSRLLIVVFFCLLSLKGLSQQILPAEVYAAEDSLHQMITTLRSGFSQNTDTLNQRIIQVFSEALTINESFNYDWPKLDMIGKVITPDQQVRIFTWNMENEKGLHTYSGLIQQRRIEKRNQFNKVFILNDQSEKIKNPEKAILDENNWFGALYYNSAVFKHRKEIYYVILGFDFNNSFSNKKIIEILKIDDNSLNFGEEIKKEKDTVQRMIFEYSAETVLTLRYDSAIDQIVFDHLAPLNPMFKGAYRFYVPDGSYDSLEFNKGEFKVNLDIDVRNIDTQPTRN